MWPNWFKPKPEKAIGKSLYAAIVQAARQPALYGERAVPDTIEGRLELILLHASLVIRTLRLGGSDEGRVVSQIVFDTMFEDFDIAMRELGLGDSGVGKKIRFMAQGFYGRAQSYAEALDSADPSVLEGAVSRNLLASEEADPRAGELALYVRRAAAALDNQGEASLLREGNPDFGVA
tara:strand:+ start:44568 stop:45101 length:534 start_codon:yes stop_codon:yes gene_type:complete